MQSVDTPLEDLRERIARATRDAGRQPDSVRLVAVSKTRTADDIRRVARAGVRDVGENYVTEALPKIAALTDCDLTWHFIGAIQSNKTRDIAMHFDWVHTVDREKVARRLSDQRPAALHPLDVLIQVNIDREPQKAGVPEERLAELARYVASLPRLRLRGLMGLPRESAAAEERRAAFHRLAQLFSSCRPASAADWDSLSMGMSADFEIAISEGATLIRLGTALFGPRTNG